jgi:RHS repeat-associated protein
VHDSVNELTQRTIGQGGAIDLTYDDAGNLTQDGGANGDHQYVWDYRNRLIQAKEKQSGDWSTVGAYKYDPQGRRVRKAVTNKGALNGTIRFVWGGDSDWQCLEERDGSDNLAARFTYSPGYIDAVAVQERDLNADSDFGDTNEVVYYQANTLFSVYALSDASGSVVERYRFDAYGGCTVLDADGSADADGLSDVKNPYTFTGRRLDPESGLMQYRHRHYSSGLGRFVSRDPDEYAEWFDLYCYVLSRVTVDKDPLGLASDCTTTTTVTTHTGDWDHGEWESTISWFPWSLRNNKTVYGKWQLLDWHVEIEQGGINSKAECVSDWARVATKQHRWTRTTYRIITTTTTTTTVCCGKVTETKPSVETETESGKEEEEWRETNTYWDYKIGRRQFIMVGGFLNPVTVPQAVERAEQMGLPTAPPD